MIVYLATRDQLVVHAGYLSSWGREVARSIRLMSYDELFGRRRLPEATWIFADLERLSVTEREQAAAVWEALARDLPAGRLLNHPLRARRRYSLLRALYDEGINDFDVFRVDEPRRPGRYPVFLRRENGHDGALSGLLGSADAVDREIDALLRRGVAPDDLLIVEFAGGPDGGGRYWKHSAFRIGDRLVPGHLFVDEDWVVKAPEVLDPEIVEAERAFVDGFGHEAALERAFAVAGIDFGRADYAVTDGGIRVFEINTHPTVMGPDDNHADSRREARGRSARRVAAALAELDTAPSRRAARAPRADERSLRRAGPRFALLHRCLAAVGAGRWAPALHRRSTAGARALRNAAGWPGRIRRRT